MRKVILTVGMRGVGKTTFCRNIVANMPDIVFISRDDILIELFGEVCLSSYSDGHFVAAEEMWKRVEQNLVPENVTIILDTWNGFARERCHITDELSKLGADRIEAWRFMTPERVCVKWFVRREISKPKGGEKLSKWRLQSMVECCRLDYRLYDSEPLSLEQGFHLIREINPLQLTLFPYSYLLL